MMKSTATGTNLNPVDFQVPHRQDERVQSETGDGQQKII